MPAAERWPTGAKRQASTTARASAAELMCGTITPCAPQSRMRVESCGSWDDTRAIGVMPRPSAATQIPAAVSNEVGLCSRSIYSASKPQLAAIIATFGVRSWFTPKHRTSSCAASFCLAMLVPIDAGIVAFLRCGRCDGAWAKAARVSSPSAWLSRVRLGFRCCGAPASAATQRARRLRSLPGDARTPFYRPTARAKLICAARRVPVPCGKSAVGSSHERASQRRSTR